MMRFHSRLYVSVAAALVLAGCGKPGGENRLEPHADVKADQGKASPAAGTGNREEKPHAADATAPAQKHVEPSLAVATVLARPYVKQGFALREDYWGGDLPVKTPKAIVHQLFKGNEYWFLVGSDTPGARVSVHVYDADGKKAESESWEGEQGAGAAVKPEKTGTYYLVIEVGESTEERTRWTLVYGFR